jgi:hypothetical protein
MMESEPRPGNSVGFRVTCSRYPTPKDNETSRADFGDSIFLHKRQPSHHLFPSNSSK